MDTPKQFCPDNIAATLPAASLLICSRNRPQMLWETIQSVLEGCAIPAEIIVIDQSDAPNAVLSDFRTEKDCTLHYIWSERRGVSLGRNMAIVRASHSLLVITDDDMLMPASWFETIVRALVSAGPQSVITGQVLISASEHEEGFAPSIKADQNSIRYAGRVGQDILYTGNMAIHRSAFESIGMFDERLGPGTEYPAAEDNDLCFRLLEAKYHIIYEPNALLYHRAWRSGTEFLSLHWNYGLGQGAFYAKYFSLRDTYMIERMVRDTFAYLLRFPVRILFDRKQAHKDVLFVSGLLYGAIRWQLGSSKISLEQAH